MPEQDPQARVAASNIERAADRVDFRLTYDCADAPRKCHIGGIDGALSPDGQAAGLPNAYYGRAGHEHAEARGSGDWCDPEHPDPTEPENAHIERWFVTAVREAVHEALEWFWVDGAIFLDPHGEHELQIRDISAELAHRLSALRHPLSTENSTTGATP